MTHSHPMHAAFLADIREHPEDDFPRQVYADWLEQYGDAEDLARAEFIRVQCELASQIPEPALRELWFGGRQNHLNDIPKQAWDNWNYLCKQLRRAGELAKKIEPKHQFVWNWYWRRGFTHTVRCPTALWLQHRVELVTRHPVQRVELTDKRPLGPFEGRLFPIQWCVFRSVEYGSGPDELNEDLVGKRSALHIHFKDDEAAFDWLSDRLIARAMELAGLGGQGESS